MASLRKPLILTVVLSIPAGHADCTGSLVLTTSERSQACAHLEVERRLDGLLGLLMADAQSHGVGGRGWNAN
jgi:hypothetical protein